VEVHDALDLVPGIDDDMDVILRSSMTRSASTASVCR
jgi:hypothetical protein